MDSEQRILSLLNCLSHPNIVELLGSYTIGHTHNFLFPLAHNDLLHFLTLTTEECHGFGFISHIDYLMALCGLTSAVNALHHYVVDDLALIGCHHDLKPGNILVSNKTFLLANFGLSTFKTPEQGSKTYFKKGIGYYFAPECEDPSQDFKKSAIYRSSDIWSLGCIIIDVLIFMLHGAARLDEFKSDRKVTFGGWFTTYTFHYGSLPNPGVERWLSNLRLQTEESALSPLIDLIEVMLKIDQAERPTAAETLARLRVITLQCIHTDVISQYQELHRSDALIDISIEHERYACWAWGVGLASTMQAERPNSNFESHRDSHFSTIVEKLTMMKEELIAAVGSRDNFRPICMPLRRLNDALMGLLEIGLRKEVETRLELHLLHSDLFVHKDQHQVMEVGPLLKNVHVLAAVKAMHLLSFDASEKIDQSLLIDKDSLRDWRSFGTSDTATLIDGQKTARVLIERMVYKEEQTGQVLKRRADAVARFLRDTAKPSSFLTLDYRGYMHDISRHAFAMAYDISSMTDESAPQPISLYTFIKESDNVRARPLLNEVFDMAFKLATAIFQCHKAEWLHKDISSHNIIFKKAQSPFVAAIDSPRIVGFNLSRPDHPNEFTKGPEERIGIAFYQHPGCADGRLRYRVEFDYYSIGIVLLELGLWKTVDKLVRSRPTPQIIRKQYLPLLGPRMGKIYQDAVSVCLSFPIEDEINENRDVTQKRSNAAKLNFHSNVVRALERCTTWSSCNGDHGSATGKETFAR